MDADLGRLMQQARSASPAERMDAVKKIARVDSPDSLSILQALGATDPDRQVRLEACRAARELRTHLSSGTMGVAAQAGVGPNALAQRLQSPEATDRAKAIFGCLRYESEMVLTAILDLLEREASARVRAVAVAAVGVLGSSAEVEPVKRFLEDPDETVRAAADEALVKLGELEPMPILGRAPAPAAPALAQRPPPPGASETTPRAPVALGGPAVKAAPSSPGLPAAARPSGAPLSPYPFRGAPASNARPSPPSGTMPSSMKLASPFGRPTDTGRMLAISRPPVGFPMAEQMTADERVKLDRLLSSLKGGICSEQEKGRLAERGAKFYQDLAARLALPALPMEPARALFYLAAGNREAAAEAFRQTHREHLSLPHVAKFLTQAVSEDEARHLQSSPVQITEDVKGRDLFPPEILQVILSALRVGRGLMNELDVPERTKLRIKIDELKDYLEKGNIEEGQRCGLLLKRELTRLRFAEKKPKHKSKD